MLSMLCFRATEKEVKYEDCLCGQKKNFAQVIFSIDLALSNF